MSWNGTVRCGYCHAQGHNRRGCPKLTSDLKKSYLRSIWSAACWRNGVRPDGSRTPHSAEGCELEAAYLDRCAEAQRVKYLSRTNIDLATGKEVTKEKRQSSKRCSYCRHPGHDRRKCENLANDYKILTYQIKKDRALAAQALRDKGIAIGSLVIETSNGYNSEGNWTVGIQKVGLVTEIDLESYVNPQWGVTPSRDPYVIRCSSMDDLRGVKSKTWAQHSWGSHSRIKNLSVTSIVNSCTANGSRSQTKFVPPHDDLTAIPTEDMKIIPLKEAFPTKGNAKSRNTFIYLKPGWQNHTEDWVAKARKALGIEKADHYAAGFFAQLEEG